MALTSHDVLARLHVPDLPRAVIRCSGDDLLPLMQGHASDTSAVRLDLVCSSPASRHGLVCLREEGIWTGVFWHARVLCGALAQRALAEELRLILSSARAHVGSLALVLSFDLFLDFIFACLDGGLVRKCFLLELVLL